MKNLAKLLVSTFLLSGCATQDYVREYLQNQLKPMEARVAALGARADAADAAASSGSSGLAATSQRLDDVLITLKVHGDRLTRNEADIAQLSKSAQDALGRAAVTGKLVEGKLIEGKLVEGKLIEGRLAYEVVLTEDKVKFGSGKSVLSEDAKASLDEFAARVKSENRRVYVEVQGHTDAVGGAAFNLGVGQRRADAVLRYLHAKGGLPLPLLGAVSYGDSLPLASNQSREGRARNRRVVLVVLY